MVGGVPSLSVLIVRRSLHCYQTHELMHRRYLPVFLLCLLGGGLLCLVGWWVFAGKREAHPDALPVTTLSRSGPGTSNPSVAGPAQAGRKRVDERADPTNAAFEKMRQQARTARRQEQRDAKFWATFAVKYADENVKAPGNLDEAAVAVGRWMAEVARLKAKWGKKVPPAGTPEASAYQQDQEKLMTEMAAWGKFVADPEALASLAEPDRLAQFQTLSLSRRSQLERKPDAAGRRGIIRLPPGRGCARAEYPVPAANRRRRLEPGAHGTGTPCFHEVNALLSPGAIGGVHQSLCRKRLVVDAGGGRVTAKH